MTISVCLQMLFRGSEVPSCQLTQEAQASLDWGSASPSPQPAEAPGPPATAAGPAPGSAKRKRKASAGAAGGLSGAANPGEAPAPPADAGAELAPAKRARSGLDPADELAQVVDALKVTAQGPRDFWRRCTLAYRGRVPASIIAVFWYLLSA